MGPTKKAGGSSLNRYAANGGRVTFPEHDWRLLRVVHRTALDRYCTRVLEECVATIRGTDISPHDRYLRHRSQPLNRCRTPQIIECSGDALVSLLEQTENGRGAQWSQRYS